MGSIVTPPNTARDVATRAGADVSLATFDLETNTLTAPDVSDADLANAKTAIDGRTAPATVDDKRAKANAAATAARQRADDAVLAADATYQAALPQIAAAATLADLDGIPI